jgi:Putative Flp pilus-assembly TadE/G-like
MAIGINRIVTAFFQLMLTLRLYVILIFLFFPEDALIRSLSKKLARAALPHNFGKAQDGNILVLAGLTLPLIVGLTGLGTDTIQWTLMRQQLQRSADSAALNGAYAKAQGEDVAGVKANAKADLDKTLDGFPGINRDDIQNAPVTGKFAGNDNAVKVVLSYQKALPFSSLFMSTAPTINVIATAAVLNNGDYCVISLEDTNTIGININGTVSLDLGCGMFTNSTGNSAIILNGTISATDTTYLLGSVGNISNNGGVNENLLQPYSLAQRDPYAGLPEAELERVTKPSVCSPAPLTIPLTGDFTIPTGCYGPKSLTGTGTLNVSANTSFIGDLNINSTGKLNFDPGTYVDGDLNINGSIDIIFNPGNYYFNGNMNFNGTGTVTFNPGVYQFNGNFTVNGTQKFISKSAKIVMNKVNAPSSANNDKGNVYFNGTGTITLQDSQIIMTGDLTAGSLIVNGTQPILGSAPTTGALSGILIYADRRTTPQSGSLIINGTQDTNITGAIYAPSSRITLTGTGKLSSTCLSIVVRTISVNGTVGIASTCPVDGKDSFKGRQVRLVE